MSNWRTSAHIEKIVLAAAAGTASLFCYWYFIGKHNSSARTSLTNALNNAKQDVRELEDQLTALEEAVKRAKEEQREVRIFVDGAFDMFHFGHMNAFRLARELGTYLIVGVNSDESITICKGGRWCGYGAGHGD